MDWVQDHGDLLGWLSLVSLLIFLGTLIAVPWLVVRIPSDFFVRRQHYADRWQPDHPVLRVLFLIVKNVCGIVLVLMGVAMLVLPGQGILAILIGLLFLDFPGKFAMERWLVERRPVIHAINWLRAKAHREPLDLPKS